MGFTLPRTPRGHRLHTGRGHWLLLAVLAAFIQQAAVAAECKGTVYLTLDTGSLAQAERIADILKKFEVKATFFLANEKTTRGDYALDNSWADYWRARVAEGHSFGSHTWRHGYFREDLADGQHVLYKPTEGKAESLDATAICAELNRVNTAFKKMTGRSLDPLWRAPGGHTTPFSLAAARQCGYRHVHWAKAGFLGDELPSDRYPNEALLNKALRDIRDGDVLMMHLGIWSRREPFAPMLDPLIAGLKQQGFCFAPIMAGTTVTNMPSQNRALKSSPASEPAAVNSPLQRKMAETRS